MYVVAPLAEIVPVCPVQTVALFIVIVGFEFIVMLAVAEEVQVPFEPITVKVVVTSGAAEIFAVFAPVFHAEIVPVCPEQTVVLTGLNVGLEFTVTAAVFVTMHPPATVALTVYIVVVIGFTTILEVFAALLHVYETAAPAVRVAVCPLQIVDDVALIVALAFTVMVAVVVAVQVPIDPVTV